MASLRMSGTDFIEQGIGLVAIRDTPIIESNPTECLAKKRVSCAVARLKIDDPIVAAAADMPTIRLVDLTAAIYGAEYCEQPPQEVMASPFDPGTRKLWVAILIAGSHRLIERLASDPGDRTVLATPA